MCFLRPRAPWASPRISEAEYGILVTLHLVTCRNKGSEQYTSTNILYFFVSVINYLLRTNNFFCLQLIRWLRNKNIKRKRVNYFLRDKIAQSVKEPEFNLQNPYLWKARCGSGHLWWWSWGEPLKLTGHWPGLTGRSREQGEQFLRSGTKAALHTTVIVRTHLYSHEASLDKPGKRQPQVRNCFHQTGLKVRFGHFLDC